MKEDGYDASLLEKPNFLIDIIVIITIMYLLQLAVSIRIQ